jgi:hypothetical protein
MPSELGTRTNWMTGRRSQRDLTFDFDIDLTLDWIIKSKSKLHYNWRSVSHYVKVSSPFWDLWPDITFCPKVVFWNLLSCLFGAIPEGYIYRDLSLQVGGGLEYLHRSPASRKRRRKGNPVPEGLAGPPCSWGIWIREPGPPGWGSLSWDSKVWFRVLSDSDYWVITMQIVGPSSRQRGRPIDTRPQVSDSNIPTGSNIWSQVPQGYSIPRHTDWLVSRKVTSTSTAFGSIALQPNIVNISELLLDMWWVDKRSYSAATWYPCLKNFLSLEEIGLIYPSK